MEIALSYAAASCHSFRMATENSSPELKLAAKTMATLEVRPLWVGPLPKPEGLRGLMGTGDILGTADLEKRCRWDKMVWENHIKARTEKKKINVPGSLPLAQSALYWHQYIPVTAANLVFTALPSRTHKLHFYWVAELNSYFKNNQSQILIYQNSLKQKRQNNCNVKSIFSLIALVQLPWLTRGKSGVFYSINNIFMFPQNSKSTLKQKSSPKYFQPTFPERGSMNRCGCRMRKSSFCLSISLGKQSAEHTQSQKDRIWTPSHPGFCASHKDK